MVEQQTCCCFFSAKTGVYLFGLLSFLQLLSEIEEFVAPRFGPSLGIFLTFLMMVFADSDRSRKMFFYVYTVSCLILMIVSFWLMQRGVFKEQPWIVGCATMKAEGKFKEFQVTTEKEC